MIRKSRQPSYTAGVIAPPPLIFGGFLAFGLLCDWLIGLPELVSLPTRLLIATPCALAGLGLLVAALHAFRQWRTPPQPWRPTTAFVTTGIYRFTRNPMYLGMALIHAAIAIALHAPMALTMLAPAIGAIRTGVVLREELYLEVKYGAAYRDYASRVRRWL